MKPIWIAILGSLAVFVTGTGSSDSVISIKVDVYYWYQYILWNNYTVDFNYNDFVSFHYCLCDPQTYVCRVKLSLFPGEQYKTVNVYQWIYKLQRRQHQYSDSFDCMLGLEGKATEYVECKRRNQAYTTFGSNIPYWSFYIPDIYSFTCATPCVRVSFLPKTNNVNITSIYHKTVLTHGACVSPSFTTSTPVSPSPYYTIDPDWATFPLFSTPRTTSRRTSRTTPKTTPRTTSRTTPRSTSRTTPRTSQRTTLTTTPVTTSSTKQTTTGESSSRDNSDGDFGNKNNVFLVAVYTVAGVILVIAIILSVIIFRRRRKRNQTRSTTPSNHEVRETGIGSQNYAEVSDENLAEISQNSFGASSSAQETGKTESKEKGNQRESNAVGDSFVSTEEIIRNKRGTASGCTTATDKYTGSTDNNETVSDTKTAPEILSCDTKYGPHDTQGDFTNAAVLGATAEGSSVYSRLGDQVRIFENPYDDMATFEQKASINLETQENMVAQNSLARSSLKSPSSNQNNVPVNVTLSVSQSFANKAYEYVNVDNLGSSEKDACGGNGGTNLTPQGTSDGTEESEYTNFPKRDPAIGTEESEYTNFPKRDTELTQSIYTRLGEPVRDTENPHDG